MFIILMNSSDMRFLIYALIAVLFIQSVALTYAQTNDSSPAASVTKILTDEDAEIKSLKDKIATKVAELREKNNKAVSGFVTKISGSVITIKNENGLEYSIKLDEALTKYYRIAGTQKKEIEQSDIETGLFLIVTGVEHDRTVTANIVYIDEKFLTKSGSITEVDKENFTLSVTSTDQDPYILNIETVTKQQMMNVKTLAVEKSGFSKIKEGDTIHFVVKKKGNEKDNTYSAIKILIIPQEYFLQ